tara:strand:- start:275 stop:1423 length:1149 start_codon:yes stop_codon:yes gene_type:complete
MAVQYANIIQSLSMMLESRARREQAEEQAALQGLRIAQQDKQFQQEYALKQQQFQQQQQEFFIQQGELLRGQAEKYALEEGLGLAQAEFAPLVEGFLEKKDDKFELRGLKKDGTSDFSKELVKVYGMSSKDSVELVSQLSSLYMNESPTVQVIERTVDNWERLTKTTLSNAQNFRLYRQRYRELGEELNDIQTGDYKFDTNYSILPEGQDFVDSESKDAVVGSMAPTIQNVTQVEQEESRYYGNRKDTLEQLLNKTFRDNDYIAGSWNDYTNTYTNKENIDNIYDLKKLYKQDKTIVDNVIKENKESMDILKGRLNTLKFGGELPEGTSIEEIEGTLKLFENAQEYAELEKSRIMNSIKNINTEEGVVARERVADFDSIFDY